MFFTSPGRKRIPAFIRVHSCSFVVQDPLQEMSGFRQASCGAVSVVGVWSFRIVQEPVQQVIGTMEPAERRKVVTTLARPAVVGETAFGCPRDFLKNRFVYL